MTEVKVVNGFNIYPFESKQEFVEYLREEDPRKILIALNAEKLIKTEGDLKTIINENIGLPDGVGAVLALKKKGVKAQKIAGAEFWLNIIEEFYKEKSFYLIGAEPEVIEGTIEKLRRKFKGIRIVGYHDGFFEEEGFERILSDIERAKPGGFCGDGEPETGVSDEPDEGPALCALYGAGRQLRCVYGETAKCTAVLDRQQYGMGLPADQTTQTYRPSGVPGEVPLPAGKGEVVRGRMDSPYI